MARSGGHHLPAIYPRLAVLSKYPNARFCFCFCSYVASSDLQLESIDLADASGEAMSELDVDHPPQPSSAGLFWIRKAAYAI
jgi:hypothetical protein